MLVILSMAVNVWLGRNIVCGIRASSVTSYMGNVVYMAVADDFFLDGD